MSQAANCRGPFRPRQRGLPPRRFALLARFTVPTLGIGHGVVIPRSRSPGWNELSIGFAATVVGACLTCWAGFRLAVREAEFDFIDRQAFVVFRPAEDPR